MGKRSTNIPRKLAKPIIRSSMLQFVHHSAIFVSGVQSYFLVVESVLGTQRTIKCYALKSTSFSSLNSLPLVP